MERERTIDGVLVEAALAGDAFRMRYSISLDILVRIVKRSLVTSERFQGLPKWAWSGKKDQATGTETASTPNLG